MKQTALGIFLLFFSTSLFAQSVKFGINGGLNESTVIGYNTSSKILFITGFRAGIISQIDFNRLSLQPGLYYSTKGYRTATYIAQTVPNVYTFDGHGKATYNYLELPVNLVYNVKLMLGKIFFGGGPYYGYALSGHAQGSTTSVQDGSSLTSATAFNIPVGNDAGDLKRSDFGVNAIAGIDFYKHFLLTANYGIGLVNARNNGNEKTENRMLNISAGYLF